MGTRALIHVKDENRKTLCTIYRQLDGYPEGLGVDIKAALGGRQLVNGFSDPKKQANGMECAAALLIASLKSDGMAGNVYIYPPNSKGCGEEYVYTLSPHPKLPMINIRVAYVGERKALYSGPLALFDPRTVE